MKLRTVEVKEYLYAAYDDFMVVKADEKEHVFRCPFCGKVVTRDYNEADAIVKTD